MGKLRVIDRQKGEVCEEVTTREREREREREIIMKDEKHFDLYVR